MTTAVGKPINAGFSLWMEKERGETPRAVWNSANVTGGRRIPCEREFRTLGGLGGIPLSSLPALFLIKPTAGGPYTRYSPQAPAETVSEQWVASN